MDDGFYTMTYVGSIGMGMGVLLLEGGKVRGFDMRGGKYNGTYVRNADGSIDAQAELGVAPGIAIVTGMPAPDRPVTVLLKAKLPADAANGVPVTILVADREAQASFQFMRGL